MHLPGLTICTELIEQPPRDHGRQNETKTGSLGRRCKKGIGVWTAEMFLIFSLNRPDVLPAHDLGLRAALRERHGLPELPRPAECHALAEIWRPYRTTSTWYIWRGVDTPR
jgi:hypothetical protein